MPVPSSTPESPSPSGGRWPRALVIGLAVLGVLSALLGRLIWLPFCLGLFFFLLVGLLAGSFMFQVLRPLRPIGRVWLAAAALLLGAAGWLAATAWEYQVVVERVAAPPRFADARTELQKRSGEHDRVGGLARDAFLKKLHDDYPPGGLLGYARWAAHGGTMTISIGDLDLGKGPFTQDLFIPHRGWGWILRVAVGLILLVLGVWWPLAPLQSREPVSNLIDPEEAEAAEQEDRRQAGEAYYQTFDHTADLGVEAHAGKWSDLLEQSALGMFACVGYLVPSAASRGERIDLLLKAGSREDLLRNWLSELLFRFETRGEVPKRIRFRRTDETRLEARIEFRPFDPDRSRLHREVKAVTYHGLEVHQVGRAWIARFILDI